MTGGEPRSSQRVPPVPAQNEPARRVLPPTPPLIIPADEVPTRAGEGGGGDARPTQSRWGTVQPAVPQPPPPARDPAPAQDPQELQAAWAGALAGLLADPLPTTAAATRGSAPGLRTPDAVTADAASSAARLRRSPAAAALAAFAAPLPPPLPRAPPPPPLPPAPPHPVGEDADGVGGVAGGGPVDAASVVVLPFCPRPRGAHHDGAAAPPPVLTLPLALPPFSRPAAEAPAALPAPPAVVAAAGGIAADLSREERRAAKALLRRERKAAAAAGRKRQRSSSAREGAGDGRRRRDKDRRTGSRGGGENKGGAGTSAAAAATADFESRVLRTVKHHLLPYYAGAGERASAAVAAGIPGAGSLSKADFVAVTDRLYAKLLPKLLGGDAPGHRSKRGKGGGKDAAVPRFQRSVHGTAVFAFVAKFMRERATAKAASAGESAASATGAGGVSAALAPPLPLAGDTGSSGATGAAEGDDDDSASVASASADMPGVDATEGDDMASTSDGDSDGSDSDSHGAGGADPAPATLTPRGGGAVIVVADVAATADGASDEAIQGHVAVTDLPLT